MALAQAKTARTAEAEPKPARTAETVSRLLSEDILTMAEARGEIARATRKRPDKATLHRWVHRGVGGIRLEAVRLGRQWFTSRQAITRFAVARTAARD